MPLDPIDRLTRDVRTSAAEVGRNEARGLVDTYYRVQEHRIALDGQARALAADDRANLVSVHFASQMRTLETQMKNVLDDYSLITQVGRWSRAQHGVGPVIAAGLLAHIDITRAPTAGHIWRFAGLDPTLKWLGKQGAARLLEQVKDVDVLVGDESFDDYALSEDEVAELDELLGPDDRRHQLNRAQLVRIGQLTNRKFGNLIRLGSDAEGRVTRASMLKLLAKRPWNADLKVLCWKLGDSFVKTSRSEKSFYGVKYRERKEYELERDARGGHAEQAAETLATRNIRDVPTRKTYEAGRLPAGRLDLRARRWAVKLFLAHWHDVAYREHYGTEPPLPYPIAHLGHVHYIAPPPGGETAGVDDDDTTTDAETASSRRRRTSSTSLVATPRGSTGDDADDADDWSSL